MRFTPKLRRACIDHLRHFHGYGDQEDTWEEFYEGKGYGILQFEHWVDKELIEFHEDDHKEYPEGGGRPTRRHHHK